MVSQPSAHSWEGDSPEEGSRLRAGLLVPIGGDGIHMGDKLLGGMWARGQVPGPVPVSQPSWASAGRCLVHEGLNCKFWHLLALRIINVGFLFFLSCGK